ncbi:hypothetical protein PAPYR_12021 [Paratrimastix pyriformis]|uniref:Uncharacterized protein n=1 Tax=Paratrimastix pyriformis TaxID=342808 RepID=A0ABQ8U2P5_9EUKA|nr:hypothetical protein PAPYR_12021 [Paratrimastix pyriformis]
MSPHYSSIHSISISSIHPFSFLPFHSISILPNKSSGWPGCATGQKPAYSFFRLGFSTKFLWYSGELCDLQSQCQGVPNANSCYGVTLGILKPPFCGGYNPGGWSDTIFGNGGYLRKTCRNNPL